MTYSVITNFRTTLAQGMTSSQLTAALSSFSSNGHNIVTADYGGRLYLVIAPGAANMEVVRVTSNSGTTLTLDKRGLLWYGEDDDTSTSLQFPHYAGEEVIISNVKNVYEQLVDKYSDESIGGIKTFDELPLIPLTPTTPTQAASKGYVDTAVAVASGTTDLLVEKEGSDPTLLVTVNAGELYVGDTVINYAGSTGNAVTANDVNYVQIKFDGTLDINVTGFSEGYIQLAEVTTDATTITGVVDKRVFFTLGQENQLIDTSFTYGATLTAGDPVRVNAAASNKLILALGDSAANADGFIGIVLDDGVDTDTDLRVLVQGMARGFASGLTPNAPVYLTDVGGFSSSQGTYKKIVGWSVNATDFIILRGTRVEDLSGGDANFTTANLATALAAFISPFAQSNLVTFTADEDLLDADVVATSQADNVERTFADGYNVATMDSNNTLAGTFSLGGSSTPCVIASNISTSVKAAFFVNGSNSNILTIGRMPITPTTGAVGTQSADAAFALTNVTCFDASPTGDGRVLMTCSVANNIDGAMADLSSAISVGTKVDVDASNCSQSFCDYISDSHCLFFYEDTSTGDIVFAKYTASGTTLSASSTGTVFDLTGTNFILRGVSRFPGTNYYLFAIQNTDTGFGQFAVALYDTGTSAFTSTGAWVSTSASMGGTDLGRNCLFAPFTATQQGAAYAIDSTTGRYLLATRSGVTLTLSSTGDMSTRGTDAGYSLTRFSDRTMGIMTLNGTTAVSYLYEINTDEDGFVQRATASGTEAPDGNTYISNSGAAIFPIGPRRLGCWAIVSNNDLASGSQRYTSDNFDYVQGFATADVAESAAVDVAVSGYIDGFPNTLTVPGVYVADLGGTLTLEANDPENTSPRVLVSKGTDDGIIRIYFLS